MAPGNADAWVSLATDYRGLAGLGLLGLLLCEWFSRLWAVCGKWLRHLRVPRSWVGELRRRVHRNHSITDGKSSWDMWCTQGARTDCDLLSRTFSQEMGLPPPPLGRGSQQLMQPSTGKHFLLVFVFISSQFFQLCPMEFTVSHPCLALCLRASPRVLCSQLGLVSVARSGAGLGIRRQLRLKQWRCFKLNLT